MIAGVHTVVFAEDPEAARTFFREVLGLESVDAGDGWLIFALPPGELAVHPGPDGEQPSGSHRLFFMCLDIHRTVKELEAKGVEFVAPVSEERWGLLTRFRVPGAGEIDLYQPAHPSPLM